MDYIVVYRDQNLFNSEILLDIADYKSDRCMFKYYLASIYKPISVLETLLDLGLIFLRYTYTIFCTNCLIISSIITSYIEGLVPSLNLFLRSKLLVEPLILFLSYLNINFTLDIELKLLVTILLSFLVNKISHNSF